jgi:hypothetical protein
MKKLLACVLVVVVASVAYARSAKPAKPVKTGDTKVAKADTSAQDKADKTAKTPPPGSGKAPILSFWDNGIDMLKVEPYPLFVAWEDGTILRRVEDTKAREWYRSGRREDGSIVRRDDGKLKLFHADPADIKKLMADVDAAGWYKPLKDLYFPSGIFFPEGPLLRISVSYKDHKRVFDYHGRDDWNGRNTDSDRQPEIDAFVAMWNKVLAAMAAVPMTEIGDYDGKPAVKEPAAPTAKPTVKPKPKKATVMDDTTAAGGATPKKTKKK